MAMLKRCVSDPSMSVYTRFITLSSVYAVGLDEEDMNKPQVRHTMQRNE